MDIIGLIGRIARLIINPIITLGFIVATVYLFYGIFEMILNADDGKDLEKNKETVKYGVIGLFVMFSVYGILRIALATFEIPCGGLFFCTP